MDLKKVEQYVKKMSHQMEKENFKIVEWEWWEGEVAAIWCPTSERIDLHTRTYIFSFLVRVLSTCLKKHKSILRRNSLKYLCNSTPAPLPLTEECYLHEFMYSTKNLIEHERQHDSQRIKHNLNRTNLLKIYNSLKCPPFWW